MRRGVILATLALLLLAVTGITLARESTIRPESNSLTESTVQDTTTTGEPSANTVREFTDTADEGSAQRSEPAAGSMTQYSTEPEADELEVTEEEAAKGKAENMGKPEDVGKAQGVGGKPVGNGRAKDNEGEASGGGGQQKVTLCHKGHVTITVDEHAWPAHRDRHGDTLGVCQTAGVKPGPPEETPGPGVAQNGGGGGQQKVTICHKGKHTITVGAPAQAAHLRHGDTEGPCVGQ